MKNIDWPLVGGLAFVTLLAYVFGVNAGIKVSAQRIAKLETEVLRAEVRCLKRAEALIVYEARGIGIRSEVRPPGSHDAPRGPSPTPSARLVAPGPGGSNIKEVVHAL